MTAVNLLELIGEADDSFIVDAKVNRQIKTPKWIKYGAIAACFCLLIVGLLPRANKTNAPGFVFTAYALDANNRVISSEMAVGESVPISSFESKKGLKGFFFSYPFVKNEQNDAPSRIILGDGILNSCTEEDIIQIALDNSMDMNQNYVIFVISSNTKLPYDFPYVCTTYDSDVIYQMDLRIDEADEGYNATLLKVTKINRVYNPPESELIVSYI